MERFIKLWRLQYFMVDSLCEFFETCPTREIIEKLKAKYKNDGEVPYYGELKRIDTLVCVNYCTPPPPPAIRPKGFKHCPTYLHLTK